MEVDTEHFSVTCHDGTLFMLFDEHVRGEPRFYWAEHKPPGASKYERVKGCEGAFRKPVAWTELKRLARAWEEIHPAIKQPYNRRRWTRR